MGGKNPFLGIAYVVVGGICIVLGALFTVAHLVKPRYAPSILGVSGRYGRGHLGSRDRLPSTLHLVDQHS